MSWLVLGAAVLVAALLAANWLANADPRALVRGLKWLGVGVAAVAAAALVASGRYGLLLPALIFLAPQARRWLFSTLGGGWAGFPGGGPTAGGSSGVETRTLRMTLDHDTGTVDGRIQAGAFAGRLLSNLSQAELEVLLHEVRMDDPESAPLVEAFLDRAHPDWRDGPGDSGADRPPESGKAMSRKEAYGILDLAPGATHDEIKAAHHRLMKKLHPDQGGSTYLATKINQAKDILLGS